jgi:hypothetical protein
MKVSAFQCRHIIALPLIKKLLMASGETEEQFERTVALVREVGFDRVNTAAYSPRPATPAATWEHQVADLIKRDRLNRLNRVVNEVAEERAQRFLGRDLEVRRPFTVLVQAPEAWCPLV